MGRKIVCTNCGNERETEEGGCLYCGSKEITVQLAINDSIHIGETIRGKVKEPGKKRPTKEFKYGDDYNRNLENYVDRTMVIDRDNNQYHEVIKDKHTGEILHQCSETLDSHYGHGNAKMK